MCIHEVREQIVYERLRSENQAFCLVIVTPGRKGTFSTLPERLRKTAECSSSSIEKYVWSAARLQGLVWSRRQVCGNVFGL